ncbi:MAG: NifB/NifX family molybdenum-iron cluster-binding protein [Anaerolineae bacterium]|nr:NifB/NifX family molybdenum-iron cluster-binding protein [Anaerolineae bacterium]
MGHEHEHKHARVNAKVAIATDDGLTVRDTFSGAAYYAVLTVRESDIVHSELREAPSDAAGNLAQTIGALADCQVALARRMDDDMRRTLQQAGIQPVATAVELVEDAVDCFVMDTLAELGR